MSGTWLRRSRYHALIVTIENAKMIVDIALISGVLPRRSRDQISICESSPAPAGKS